MILSHGWNSSAAQVTCFELSSVFRAGHYRRGIACIILPMQLPLCRRALLPLLRRCVSLLRRCCGGGLAAAATAAAGRLHWHAEQLSCGTLPPATSTAASAPCRCCRCRMLEALASRLPRRRHLPEQLLKLAGAGPQRDARVARRHLLAQPVVALQHDLLQAAA